MTSTSKDGLERAVAKIEELMQQELPNLVDERRFRRREPEQVERDEFGRVCPPEGTTNTILTDPSISFSSVNGRKNESPSTSNPYQASTSERRSSAMAVHM